MDIPVERRTVLVTVATGKMLKGNIGLITIANFDSRCAQETIAIIDSLLEQGAVSLIFDVRNNPGGYASELVKVLDYLLPEGELFRTVDYAGTEDVDYSDAACIDPMPIAVLVNAQSYSAAEFFAAALRDYDAAVIVGEKTCGKGYFQYTYPLNDGSAVGLSVGEYFTPKGQNLAGIGLTPDYEVAVDEETFMAIYAGTLEPMEDPQILKAMEPCDRPVLLNYDYDRNGELTGDLADREQLILLKTYVMKILGDMVDDIASGNVEPNPYTRGTSHNACTFCPYGAVCHAGQVEGRRNYKTMKPDRFWQEVSKEVDPHG